MDDIILVNAKPFSVNEAWKGRRFKTAQYNRYSWEVIAKLPRLELPEPPLAVHLVFGFSSSLSDIDNPVKPFLDILQTKYKFNDRDVYELHVFKRQVKKGNEYIGFMIEGMKKDVKINININYDEVKNG